MIQDGGFMRDLYEVQLQHTAGAYKTIQIYYREKDAIDYLKSIAARFPQYPYDGESWTYAIGSSVHNKDRYRILKNGKAEKEQNSLTRSVRRVKI